MLFITNLDQCGAMGPLIDAELEKLDRRHAHLTKLGGHLMEALDMYRSLMREIPQQQQQQQQPTVAMPGYPYAMVNNPAAGMKYPAFPQPQAPPQSPSLGPFAAPNPNNPMPYAMAHNMAGQSFIHPYAGHPPPPPPSNY